jgi:glucuronokinase
MQLLRRRAYARAGLIGNPSDGYFGKTISLSVRDYYAEVVLYEWDELEIVLSQDDRTSFRTIQELSRDVVLHGYYGGVRLVKATIKKFVEYCEQRGHRLHSQNFAIRYSSNIPRQVGLAGSSAIIVATLRCLMDFYQVGIERRVQPSLALAVEKEELGIGAGLQDRVIQVYEGLVAMDFSQDRMERVDRYSCGVYRWLDPGLLPPVYVAFRDDVSEPTEVFHNHLRTRYDGGDVEVIEAMQQFAELTDEAESAMETRDYERLSAAINANFDLRQRICRLNPHHVAMVAAARSVGASAKYAGSGGAIVGTFRDAEMYRQLCEALGRINCYVFRPRITNVLSYPEWLDE